MTNEQTLTLVLKDATGSYFLVSQATLEQGRVPEEHKAEVEQAIVTAQGGTGRDDVEGHLLGAFVIGVVVGFVATRAVMAIDDTGTLKGLHRSGG